MLILRAFRMLLAAGVCTVMLSCSATMPAETAPEAGTMKGPERSIGSIPDDGVVLYYLHINVRCTTCQAMEAYSSELLIGQFRQQVEAGHLAWRPVNVQDPENRHYIADFQALTRSLVLVRRQGGQPIDHKVLHEAWLHLIERSEFEQYLAAEVRDFLERSESRTTNVSGDERSLRLSD